MALTNCYLTMDDIRGRAGIADHDDDPTLDPAINRACRAIDVYCGQFFYDAGSATARTYKPTAATVAQVDPFNTTTGLVIKTDDNDDGTYETTWASTDYELDYFGGQMSNMLSAPYDRIYAIGSYYFPKTGYRRRTLEVTARWGWTAVPSSVVEAAHILSIDLWKRKDTPFGITTGSIDFGGLRIGRDLMAQVSSLLQPFRRIDRTAGIA